MPRETRDAAALRALARFAMTLQRTLPSPRTVSGRAFNWAELYVTARIAARLMGIADLRMLSSDPAINTILGELDQWLAPYGEVHDELTALLDAFSLVGCDDAAVGWVAEQFEGFLATVDPDTRRRRGVYYTPHALVRFMVRAVDDTLRMNLGITEGLHSADTSSDVYSRLQMPLPAGRQGEQRFVQVFDPSMGTGIFLAELSRCFPALVSRMSGAELSVASRLLAEVTLRRLVGRDVAHLHWANTLTLTPNTLGLIPIIIGNPPYAGVSSNRDFKELVAPYYQYQGQPINERKTWLQDDYVKFFRWAQKHVEASGVGVVAFVTPHGFLDNPTFRGMRESLMKTFTHIDIIDLHGNANRRERTPSGATDKNVFPIRQGVSVSVLTRAGHDAACTIRYGECWGDTVASKLRWLDDRSLPTIEWTAVRPDELPFHRFIPGHPADPIYQQALSVCDCFPLNSSGIITSRDRLLIANSRSALRDRVRHLLDRSVPDKSIREWYNVRDNYAWKLGDARKDLRESVSEHTIDEWLVPINYRPFQTPWIFFHPTMVWRPRLQLTKHLIRDGGPALVTVRQLSRHDEPWRHAAVTHGLVEACYLSNRTREINYVFPLRLHDGSMNVSAEARATFHHHTGNMDATEQAHTIFDYVVGLLHSEEYRTRYRAELAMDFPRIPVAADPNVFASLVQLGQRLREIDREVPSLPLAEYAANEPRDAERLSTLAKAHGYSRTLALTTIGAYCVASTWVQRCGSTDIARLFSHMDAIERARDTTSTR